MVDKIRLMALDPEVLAMLSGNTVNGDFTVTGNLAINGNISFRGFMTGGKIWSVNGYVIAANSHVGTNSNTYYEKPANLAFVKVTATGGGGGSGCSSANDGVNRVTSGGGSGATCISWFNSDELSNSELVIVMAGGRGGSNNQNGANGSNSVFGNNSIVVAGGGFGSANNLHGLGLGLMVALTPPPGNGGIAYVGTIKIPGNKGSYPFNDAGTSGGEGGSSIWGSGVRNINYGATPNGWLTSITQPTAWGVGGAGGAASAFAETFFGANGAPGVVIIEEYRWPA